MAGCRVAVGAHGRLSGDLTGDRSPCGGLGQVDLEEVAAGGWAAWQRWWELYGAGREGPTVVGDTVHLLAWALGPGGGWWEAADDEVLGGSVGVALDPDGGEVPLSSAVRRALPTCSGVAASSTPRARRTWPRWVMVTGAPPVRFSRQGRW